MKITACALLLGLLCPLLSKAIITGDNSMAEAAPSGLDWDYIYNYKNSSAAAVDPYWILTAAHVADDGPSGNLTIGATTYYQQEIVYHDSADLALVRYDKALPGYYSLYSGGFSFGTDLLLVGYGNTGTVSVTTYADSGSGSGTKRWGENEYTFFEAGKIYNAGGTTGMTTNDMFYMDFNSLSKSQEAGVGVYDSGGGTFVYASGEWQLAGINTIRGGADPYSGTYAVSVPEYETWIAQTVPEPATALLMAGIAALLGVFHRIRCMFE